MIGLLTAVVLASGLAAAPPAPQVAHGAQLAERCAACHAVSESDQSRNGDAPPFRELARRSNSVGLTLQLERIARHGHLRMRPMGWSDADSQDLAAYITSLDSR